MNDHIKDVTRRFAAAGYRAVAPALFHRAGGGTAPYDDFTQGHAALRGRERRRHAHGRRRGARATCAARASTTRRSASSASASAGVSRSWSPPGASSARRSASTAAASRPRAGRLPVADRRRGQARDALARPVRRPDQRHPASRTSSCCARRSSARPGRRTRSCATRTPSTASTATCAPSYHEAAAKDGWERTLDWLGDTSPPEPAPAVLRSPEFGGRGVLFHSHAVLLLFAATFTLYWGVRSQTRAHGRAALREHHFYASWNPVARGPRARDRVLRLLDRDPASRTASDPRRAAPAARRQPLRQPRPARLLQVRQLLPASLDEARARRVGASAPRRCCTSSCRSASRSTPSRRSATRSTSTAADCRPSATCATSCCSSCSSRTWSPGRSSAPATSCRRFAGRKRWDWARMQLGVQFFLLGLFKKLAIADRMALFADPVFADPASLRRGRGLARPSLAYALPDLLRLLRLHRHGARLRAPARLQAGAELRHAVPVAEHRRVLAALAHLAVDLAARLPVHPARRQPRRRAARPTATC